MRVLICVIVVVIHSVWGQEPGSQPQRIKPQPVPYGHPAGDLTAPKPEPPASAVQTQVPAFSDYKLGPEDLVSVLVLDSPEFSRPVRVSSTGAVRLPLVRRSIPAEGKTCRELEHEIARALVEEGLLREPTVSVTVQEFHSKPVSVSGAVRAPLVFPASRPLTLMEAIARAGGLSETAGSEILVSIPERDGQPAREIRVLAKALLERTDAAANPTLSGGEEIRVASAGRVYLIGGVARPGAVLITEDQPLTVLQALAMAGGPNPTAGSKALLLRPHKDGSQREEIAVNLKKIMRREEPDLPLKSNDIVYIPDSRARRISEHSMSSAISSFMYATVGVLLWR